MEDLFKYVTCIERKPVRLACLTEECSLSPFVCSQNCVCFWQHKSTCHIKAIEELTKSMLRVLQFEFLVMYSPILKGSSISVMGRYAQQTLPRAKNQQFALTFDPIAKQNPSNEISFRLTKIKACVGVGIFHQQTLVKNAFKYLPSSQKYLNHGAYMLLSNNYLFSSSFEQENCIESSKMNLQQGDIIHVRVVCGGVDKDNQENTTKSRIEFIEERTRRKEWLTLDWKDEESYHFGVYLYDQGDSVEILNSRLKG